MNRVVDAIPLESRAAREFSELVDKYLASSCRDAALAAQLRAKLVVWRDNDAKVQPLMQRSSLVKEVAVTSQDLTSAATAGIAALDAIEHGGSVDSSWKMQQVAAVQQTAKPKVQLLLMPAGAIQRLVEATGSPSCIR
jgi:hexosaminidase